MSSEKSSQGENIVFGMVLGFVLSFILVFFMFMSMPHQISQSTLDTICQKFTNSSVVNGSVSKDGRLVCTLPSYDSVQNIIIKTNSEALR